MAQATPVKLMTVYGGQSYDIQIRQLKRGVDVVVGTPGRLLDLLRKNVLDLSQVRYLVIDEADEMLEMGFIEDVETILAQMPGERQMALFSATLPEQVRKLAEKYQKDPQRIIVNPSHRTVEETEQRSCRVREEDKMAALVRLLEVEEVKSALIFARTKARAQEVAEDLMRRGYPAESLHGDLSQSRREFVLNRFRQGTARLLVATDVAARGLDIEDVSHVFNYDAPGDAEDYVHRIGRTGRAGRKGVAITFFTQRERARRGQIESYIHQVIPESPVPSLEEIQKRRDDRFMQRMMEQFGSDDLERARSLVERLSVNGDNLLEIAAAAIHMARAGEAELPIEEIVEPVAKSRASRSRQTAVQRSYEKAAEGTTPKPVRSEKKVYQPAEQPLSDRQPYHSSTKRPKHQPGMIRLWMNLGNMHGIRPGDVVGAIASETGIPGRAIGDIDIRSDHTFVDVSEKHVRTVLRGSGGQYLLHGKPVLLKLAN